MTNPGATTATGNGNITDLGVPNPTQHGVCWNTTGTPTTGNSKTEEGAASATGAFTSNMTGLSPNTKYYVRAYATNSAGTSYGAEVNFTTNSDGTGVPASVQDAAPNDGDGNGDGTKDSLQTSRRFPSFGHNRRELHHRGGPRRMRTAEQRGRPAPTLRWARPIPDTSTLTSWWRSPSPARREPYGSITTAPIPWRIWFTGSSGPRPLTGTRPSGYTMLGVAFGTKEIGGKTVPYAEFALTESELGDDTKGYPIVDQGGVARASAPDPHPRRVGADPAGTATGGRRPYNNAETKRQGRSRRLNEVLFHVATVRYVRGDMEMTPGLATEATGLRPGRTGKVLL